MDEVLLGLEGDLGKGLEHPAGASSQEAVLARELGEDVVDKHGLHLVLVHVLFEEDGRDCTDDVQDAVLLAGV